MHPRPHFVVLALAAALAACGDDDPRPCSGASCAPLTDSCEGVTCSGFGVCGVASGQAHCLCMAGYHAVGLTCVPDVAFAGSCTWPTSATCRDYVGAAYYEAFVRSACGFEGTYSASPCVATGAVGQCTFGNGTTTETVTYYYPPNTVDSGQAACGSGSWQSL